MAEERSEDLTFNDLLEAGLHFGHKTQRWNPKMRRYIFSKRNGIHIIDLAKTLELFEEAKQFIADTIMRGRKVLLVGTKKQAREIIQKTAEETNQPYVVNRWLGGMLTNAKTIRKSIDRMRQLEKIQEEGTEVQRSKKELAKLGRELDKLHNNLNGIRDMERLPGALVVLDINRESNAVKEARCLNIPVVATIDTNCDPDPIDYPIPANDDSIRAIELIMREIGDTIKKASEDYERVAAAEKLEREKAEAQEKAAAEAAEQARKKKEAAEREARKKAVEKAKQKAMAEKSAPDSAAGEQAAAPEPATAAPEQPAAPQKPQKTAEVASEQPAESAAEGKPEESATKEQAVEAVQDESNTSEAASTEEQKPEATAQEASATDSEEDQK